jgi:hypothetical protein
MMALTLPEKGNEAFGSLPIGTSARLMTTRHYLMPLV